MCVARIYRGEALQRLPGWGFTDAHVRIIGAQRFSLRAKDDAYGQAHGDQRKDHFDFRFVQRMRTVIASDDRLRSDERIALFENGVGGRDGRLRLR